MSQNDPNTYAKLSTAQLEDLLTRPGLSDTAQQLIQEELTNRYTEDLLKGTKAAAPQPEPASPALPPKQKDIPIPPPIIPKASPTAKDKRGGGCTWGVIVFIIIVVLYFMLNSNSNSNNSSSSYGTCETSAGSCPMQVSIPKGSPCICYTPSGQYPGVVR